MNLMQLKNTLPDFAKDIKLNLGTVLTPEGAADLTDKHIMSIALASAYTTRNASVIAAISQEALSVLSDEEFTASKAAATIMAMNNIYYRFTHGMEDPAYGQMPAKLRMNVMANPGADKVMFELASLAASAINGCGMCMNSHAAQLEKAGVSKIGIQSAIRIASVVHSAGVAMEIAVAKS